MAPLRVLSALVVCASCAVALAPMGVRVRRPRLVRRGVSVAVAPTHEVAVVDVGTMDELDVLLDAAEPGVLTLLEAYGANCPKCKRMKPKFDAFAAAHPDVRCLAVNLSEVAGAYKALEVTNVPAFYALSLIHI